MPRSTLGPERTRISKCAYTGCPSLSLCVQFLHISRARITRCRKNEYSRKMEKVQQILLLFPCLVGGRSVRARKQFVDTRRWRAHTRPSRVTVCTLSTYIPGPHPPDVFASVACTKQMSKTTTIAFLMIFAIVMFLSGSLLINFYNQADDALQKNTGLHWWCGLLSILAGLASTVLTLLYMFRSEKIAAVKQALK